MGGGGPRRGGRRGLQKGWEVGAPEGVGGGGSRRGGRRGLQKGWEAGALEGGQDGVQKLKRDVLG